MTRIGFVGLGIMGLPMARNLLVAGHPLVVFNRTTVRAEGLVADGAQLAGSPREVAERSDVVILMLPDSLDVEAVVLGPNGVAEGVRDGMLVVDMSSIAPATARLVHGELADKGVAALDAPVSGGEAAAISGQLSIMVGGDKDALDRARPIFEIVGKATTHVGPAGAGQVAKSANQVVVGLTIQAVSEALALSHAAGVNPNKVRQALLGGFAQSTILEVHGERMLQGNFAPGFKLKLHRKDLDIALQTARATGIPMVATAQTAEIMNQLIGAGEGESDHSVLSRFYGRTLDDPPAAA